MLAGLMLTARPVHADTFTVTSALNSGAGSLRQAIEVANARSGADTIKFNIPGSDLKTIASESQLPGITESPNNQIGGAEPGAGNVIAFNCDSGIEVAGSSPRSVTGNRILGNSIFSNWGPAIDLNSE